ncbi:MAG: hypothetical protein IJP77_06200 [Bacteroidales bacterium]|nr:hypothetical protein [Bacteroidales bacterium]
MPRFTIYSQDGLSVRYTGSPTYHGTFLKPAYLEFREIASPTLIPWEIGDYVDYSRTGFRYKLYTIPQPTKQAVKNSNGDSFVYRDVQLFCASKDLEIAPFGDLVISDNTIHFTTLPSVSTYEDVYGIARRIQANMDSFFGEGAWVIRVYDNADPDLRAVMLEAKEFSVSDGTCLDALSQIYANWKGIGWVYSVENGVNTITIGRPNMQDSGNTTSIFAYGLGNGIRVLKKEQSGKSDLATRIYAYGSTRNLVARYYNNLSPAIKDAESVYIPNLMIPLSHWGETGGKKDARKAYIDADAATIARFGLRPKRIYFDGSGDYEEIYPSLETMTAGQLRATMQPTDEYYPSATFAADHQRVDEVAAAENPSDNGVISSEDGGKYIQTVSLPGVSGQYTYNFAKGQESAKIPLTGISLAGTITATGKVLVTPSFTATINSGANLGALSVRLWIEIGGVKYGNPACNITRGVGNTYNVTLDPFEILTEDTGQVILTGYIFAAPTSKDAAFALSYNLSVGTTTLAVQIVPSDSFKVHIRQVGFDISKQQSAISDGLCTIAFKSGWCAGREFTVKKCTYQASNDRWVLTVARHNDESINQYFPNSIYRIEPGDRFVLTDLTMPEVYITAAQQRLYARAQEALTALSTPKIIYEPQIDAKVMAASGERITEGMWMPVRDADLVDDVVTVNGQSVHQEWVLIDTVEIDEGAYEIPTYKVTLQDEKRESFLARISRQSGQNTRSITEIELRDLRTEVDEATPSISQEDEISVDVVASHPIIGYELSFDETPVNDVVLTCETTGIDNPSYQWYYLGAVGWVEITGATAQAYSVLPTGGPYYQNGEIVEDFRCVVNGNPDLSDSVQIMKVLSNAMSISLSNPAHIFAAGVQYAAAATDRSDVLGYKGVDRFATKVDMSSVRFLDSARNPLPVAYTGGKLQDTQGRNLTDSRGYYLTVASGSGASLKDATTNNVMMTVEVVDNETTTTYLNISTTTYLNIPAGVIEIPVIIKDAEGTTPTKVVKLYYSWGLALQGNNSFTSIVFKRNATQPATPTGGDYDHPVPSGWSDGIPEGDATLWMSKRIFSANGFYPQEATWSEPTGAFDTADVDFEFSALATNPGTPSSPATGANWHNTATANDIWMAVRKKVGGVWDAWEVVKVKGEKGDSPVFADIDNEMDGIAVGSDAVLQGQAVLNTHVSLWYGDAEDTISGIVPTVSGFVPVSQSQESNISVTLPSGAAAGLVRVTIADETDFSLTDKVEVSLLITGSVGSRSVVYTILPIKEGEDGVVFTLVPDYDVVKGARNADNTITYTPTAVKVARNVRKGSGELQASTYGEIRYSVDGGTTISANYNPSTGVSVASAVEAGKIIFYWYSASGASGVMIDRETIPIITDGAKGEDGVIGANGYSSSTVYLYRRSSGGTLNVPASDYVYRFADGKIYAANDTDFQTPLSTIEGWSTAIPTGNDPCYVTMAFVQGNEATADLLGGLTTAGGSWSAVTRLTGDNGLRGKIMRGVNEFSSDGLPDGRPDGQGGYTDGYQGMEETATNIIYYDVVYTEGATRNYYYCKNGVGAENFEPGVDTGWEAYWEPATNFNFIATKVLIASNAFIDVFSGNAAYMYDDGQTYIVAGMQGGSSATSGGSTVPQVNFFAGTNAQEQNPLNAPYRVTYEGKLYCTDATIRGGSLIVDGQAATEGAHSQIMSIKTNQGISAKRAVFGENQNRNTHMMFINDLTYQEPLLYLESNVDDAIYVVGSATFNGNFTLDSGSENKIGSRDILSSAAFKRLDAVTSYPSTLETGVLYLLFESVQS